MTPSWSVRTREAWSCIPLRQKLALSVWLAVVPITMLATLVGSQHAHDVVMNRMRQQLIWNAEQASAYLDFWELNHLHDIHLLSSIDDVQSLHPPRAGAAIKEMVSLYPHYGYTIARNDGQLIIQDGSLRLPISPVHMPSLMHKPTSAFAKAAQGVESSSLLFPPLVRTPCVVSAVPVYELRHRSQATDQHAVVGVLGTCLPLDKLGSITGIDNLIRATSGSRSGLPLIDFERSKRYGYALMVVFGQNSFIVLGDKHDDNNQLRRYDPRLRSAPEWSSLTNLAMSGKAPTAFSQIRIGSVKYYVGIDRRKPGRTLMMVIDQGSAFAAVNQFITWIWIGNLVALSASSIAVYRICGDLAKPIDQAGEALSRISRGEFGAPLPTSQSDVGRLFDYVNRASEQLQAYLKEAQQHAITDVQLKEARRIQADFLLPELPSSPQVTLAALFQPAYAIGADWYDAITINGLTILVVADVCDKGIPSALYMSVFRSLLRLTLLTEFQKSSNVASTLSQSVTTVNEYMATTHGSTGMFATVFLAAVDPSSARLIHVVAGHEPPLLQIEGSLIQLPVGGPAVGLFSGAQFIATSCPFPEGALILAFSDGLPDARDPYGLSFGDQKVKSVLQEKSSTAWTPDDLIDRLHRAVTNHINGAEPFDDLTLLVAKRPASSD